MFNHFTQNAVLLPLSFQYSSTLYLLTNVYKCSIIFQQHSRKVECATRQTDQLKGTVLNNAAALLRTAQTGVPALETTLVHLSRPTVVQTLAIGFARLDPALADFTATMAGQKFEDLVAEDFAQVVATYRSRLLLPLEIGIAQPCLFGAVAGLVRNMGQQAPFNPADLPSHDCLNALHDLHSIGEVIVTALDYNRYSAN